MVPPPAPTARLQGVVAVVSTDGASRALAARLAAEGAAVVIVSADGAAAGSVTAEIRSAGGRADVVVTDEPPSAADLEAVVEILAEVHRR